MNGIKDLYVMITLQWLILELINIINIKWFKKIKETKEKGIVLEILPQRHYSRKSIYADIYVQTESLGKVKARCSGWYPKIDEEVILKGKWLNDSYLCLSSERYLKERLLNVFLIPLRVLTILIWCGLLLWIIDPTLVRNILKIFRKY